MFKELEPLDKEYYQLIIDSHKQPDAKPLTVRSFKYLFWGVLCLSLVAEVGIIMVQQDSANLSQSLRVTNYMILAYTLVYGIAVIVVSPNRIIVERYRIRVVLLFAALLSVQLATWDFCVSLSVMANRGAIQYGYPSILVLLLGIGFNIWVLRRTKRQILKGALKKGGDGLLGIRNKPFYQKWRSIVLVAAPAFTSLVVGLSILNIGLNRIDRFTNRRPEPSSFEFEGGAPFMLSLLAAFLFCSCAAATYYVFLMLHLYRKFGYEWPLAENPPKNFGRRL